LVEQRIENPRVGGSTPSLATISLEKKAAIAGRLFFFISAGPSNELLIQRPSNIIAAHPEI
jgi:hypothetical protein